MALPRPFPFSLCRVEAATGAAFSRLSFAPVLGELQPRAMRTLVAPAPRRTFVPTRPRPDSAGEPPRPQNLTSCRWRFPLGKSFRNVQPLCAQNVDLNEGPRKNRVGWRGMTGGIAKGAVGACFFVCACVYACVGARACVCACAFACVRVRVRVHV